eukprot:538170-Rhodomonas_salina.1
MSVSHCRLPQTNSAHLLCLSNDPSTKIHLSTALKRVLHLLTITLPDHLPLTRHSPLPLLDAPFSQGHTSYTSVQQVWGEGDVR